MRAKDRGGCGRTHLESKQVSFEYVELFARLVDVSRPT